MRNEGTYTRTYVPTHKSVEIFIYSGLEYEFNALRVLFLFCVNQRGVNDTRLCVCVTSACLFNNECMQTRSHVPASSLAKNQHTRLLTGRGAQFI